MPITDIKLKLHKSPDQCLSMREITVPLAAEGLHMNCDLCPSRWAYLVLFVCSDFQANLCLGCINDDPRIEISYSERQVDRILSAIAEMDDQLAQPAQPAPAHGLPLLDYDALAAEVADDIRRLSGEEL